MNLKEVRCEGVAQGKHQAAVNTAMNLQASQYEGNIVKS
jgi:hypothetical protein